MDALTPDIIEVAPTDPVAADIVTAHLNLMRATSPICSVHAMEASDLAEAGARFFVHVKDDKAVAMGALKVLTPTHAELKSMHVRDGHRGQGLADAILNACLEAARKAGCARVSLETGSRPAFAPAVAFYKRQGFQICSPFGDYDDDPESVFMTLLL